jgi:hypothetical protein
MIKRPFSRLLNGHIIKSIGSKSRSMCPVIDEEQLCIGHISFDKGIVICITSGDQGRNFYFLFRRSRINDEKHFTPVLILSSSTWKFGE